MKKKLAAVLICGAMAFSLAACGSSDTSETGEAQETEETGEAEEALDTAAEEGQTDADVFTEIDNAMLGEIKNGELVITDQMADYVENGVTLFGDVSGEIQVQVEPIDQKKLWYIMFISEETTEERLDEALEELISVYGEDYTEIPLESSDKYEWEQDTYDQVCLEINNSDQTMIIQWFYNLN